MRNIITRYLLFILTLIFLSYSCVPEYMVDNKWRKTFLEEELEGKTLSNRDTLYIKDFVLCRSYQPLLEKRDYSRFKSVEEEILMSTFFTALNKLNVPVVIEPNRENRCDESFYENYYFRMGKIDFDQIREMAKSHRDKIVLIPFIYSSTIWRPGCGGGTMTPNDCFLVVNFLHIGIFMVYDDRVFYRKTVRHTLSSEVETEESPYSMQTQENWDRLLMMVMEDYFERLERR